MNLKKLREEDKKSRKWKDRGILAKIEDPIAYFLAYLFIQIGVTPNVVSFLMIPFCLIGAVLIYYGYAVLGILSFMFADNLDYVDGMVARITQTFSKKGLLYDAVHHFLERTIFFIAIGYAVDKLAIGVCIALVFLFIQAFVLAYNAHVTWDDRKFRKLPIVLIYGGLTAQWKFLFLFGFIIYLINPIGLAIIQLSLIAVFAVQTIRLFVVPLLLINEVK